MPSSRFAEFARGVAYVMAAILFGVIAALFLVIIEARKAVPAIIDQERVAITRDVNGQIVDSQSALIEAINGWTRVADARLAHMEGTLDKHMNNIEGVANRLELDGNTAITRLSDQTDRVTRLADTLNGPVAQIAGDLSDVSRNHLQEKGNGAAWPVKITALLGEASRTSDSIRRAADTAEQILAKEGPPIVAAFRESAQAASGIAADAHETAGAVTDWVDQQVAPKPWWKQVLDQVKAWAVIAAKILAL
jgi:methyl-accepting chemotaxis protein